jgi:hypothetical protein
MRRRDYAASLSSQTTIKQEELSVAALSTVFLMLPFRHFTFTVLKAFRMPLSAPAVKNSCDSQFLIYDNN